MRAADAVRLAGDPGVRAVTLDGKVEQTEGGEDGKDGKDGFAFDVNLLRTAYAQSIGSDLAWAYGDSGRTGAGVGVAVIDTGIAGDHADFRTSESNPASRVVANAVMHPDATNPGDGVGHGTHVAGLIAGNGTVRSSSDPRDNRYVGVAPQANLINVKASDDAGNTTVADVINGLQFVVDKKRDYNIRVVNLSLTSTVAQSYTIDPLAAAAEQAHFAGILVVAASGNSGPDSVNFSPGNDPYVLSVGGADDRGTKDPRDDVIASWTSTGTTQDGFRKPEVMAPGARLVSTLAPGARTRRSARPASSTVSTCAWAAPRWPPASPPVPRRSSPRLVPSGRRTSSRAPSSTRHATSPAPARRSPSTPRCPPPTRPRARTPASCRTRSLT